MAIVYYPAFITQWEGEAGFSVRFPDLDGCNTCGDTFEEALFMAQDALSTYADGEVLPPPTPFERVDYQRLDDADKSVLVAVQMIPLTLQSHAKRYQITVDEALMQQAERLAAYKHSSRSGIITEALRSYLRDASQGQGAGVHA